MTTNTVVGHMPLLRHIAPVRASGRAEWSRGGWVWAHRDCSVFVTLPTPSATPMQDSAFPNRKQAKQSKATQIGLTIDSAEHSSEQPADGVFDAVEVGRDVVVRRLRRGMHPLPARGPM